MYSQYLSFAVITTAENNILVPKEFINQEIDDIISGFNRDDHETFFGSNDEFDDEVSWDDDSISSDGHKFQ